MGRPSPLHSGECLPRGCNNPVSAGSAIIHGTLLPVSTVRIAGRGAGQLSRGAGMQCAGRGQACRKVAAWCHIRGLFKCSRTRASKAGSTTRSRAFPGKPGAPLRGPGCAASPMRRTGSNHIWMQRYSSSSEMRQDEALFRSGLGQDVITGCQPARGSSFLRPLSASRGRGSLRPFSAS